MIDIVIDVSVAAKWLLPREPLVDEALRILRRSQQDIQFIAPESFWAELGNVLWKAVERRRWSALEAREAFRSIRPIEIDAVPLEQLLDEALEISLAYHRTFYDSLYVALAVACQRSG